MISIRPMTALDIASGMRLKTEAGWNQLEADWRRFLDLGEHGCFVAVDETHVVGSVTTCRFGTIGWVAMLLVDRARRGAGIGRRLLLRAIESLEERGTRSIRLDATPLGRPLYESLGFQVDFPLHRHVGIAGNTLLKGSIRAANARDRNALIDLDRQTTRTDRRVLIERLLDDSPQNAWVAAQGENGPIRGFALWRPGSLADQIGPCIAEPEVGCALLDQALHHLAGRRVCIDVPGSHPGSGWAETRGLPPVRDFWRMTRGAPAKEDLPRLWASSGPEMG